MPARRVCFVDNNDSVPPKRCPVHQLAAVVRPRHRQRNLAVPHHHLACTRPRVEGVRQQSVQQLSCELVDCVSGELHAACLVAAVHQSFRQLRLRSGERRAKPRDLHEEGGGRRVSLRLKGLERRKLARPLEGWGRALQLGELLISIPLINGSVQLIPQQVQRHIVGLRRCGDLVEEVAHGSEAGDVWPRGVANLDCHLGYFNLN
mmetsp:Transcript_30133/g.73864  ORF Transcript_30133/g.73864 Transcript_30133/m.73864 type:complete len:205 (-) Transcript_30133:330-944(-)